MAAQKSRSIFFWKKVANTWTPPCLPTCVIWSHFIRWVLEMALQPYLRVVGGVVGSIKKLIIGRMSIILCLAESPIKKFLFPSKIMFIRPLDHFLWNFEKWNFSKDFTTEIQQKLKSNEFSFCYISVVKIFEKTKKISFQNSVEKDLKVVWTWFLKKTKPF